jgi:ApbE superfamily uncharacterized protein (UPF0280 family)
LAGDDPGDGVNTIGEVAIPPPRRLRIAWLPDGKRLHLQNGPIDLVIRAFGRPGDIARAYDAAIARTRGLLDELYSELMILREPAPQLLEGRVARRMNAAVVPFCVGHVITPMAAIGGAVADDVLAAMREAAPLERAFVNNGGDIALHLALGQSFTNNMAVRPNWPGFLNEILIEAASPTRGIANAGWNNGSYSCGIADAVTVTAPCAASADAAATIIANAVDLPGHKAVRRVPASVLSPHAGMGDVLVTTAVATLSAGEQMQALEAGGRAARGFCEAGLITGAAMRVKGESLTVGAVREFVFV